MHGCPNCPPPHKRTHFLTQYSAKIGRSTTSDTQKKRRTEDTQRKDMSTNKEQETLNKAGKVKTPKNKTSRGTTSVTSNKKTQKIKSWAQLHNSKNAHKQQIGRRRTRRLHTGDYKDKGTQG